MPYLKIKTNHPLDAAQAEQLLERASARIADALSKPERYVMVDYSVNPQLLFSGTPAPCAYVELKSIGLPASQTRDLSEKICALLGTELGIAADRIYIEFTDVPRKFWGWNGSTF
ncbi:MAG: phenylpyruvate tautomerase MIF-related protein [Methylococcaceae bacterium]|nr:phenylpyruvate tautomerase MIF-related protein [Methylococcaceae bacterium]